MGILAGRKGLTHVTLSASDINWQLAPAEDSSSRQLVSLITKTLPSVEDPDLAALLRECAVVLTGHDEDGRAIREVLSASLTRMHNQQVLLTKKDAALRRLYESHAALAKERRTAA